MTNSGKILLAGLAATLLLAVAVGSASARRIETSEQHFLAIWTLLNFNEAGGGTPIECPVTLAGSFHSKTLSKVCGQLVGYVTEAHVAEASCHNERARVLPETLPWHIQYNSFTGTLPNITSIKTTLIGAAFLVRAFGFISCLYRTSQAQPAVGIINVVSGTATSLRADETRNITSQTGGCPAGNFGGTSELFVQESPGLTSTRIAVRLVQ